jgi:tetratricopeptide (TPR) repeat protein
MSHASQPRFLVGLLIGFCIPLAARAHASSQPHWIRISSSHFSLLTDANEKKGRETVLRLEQMRALFGELLVKKKLTLPEPLDVIGLKDDKEYAAVTPNRLGPSPGTPGFFIPGDDRNYIVLDLAVDDSWRAISHPFAHLMLNYNYPPTQAWFDEGFAEYFSSLELDNKQARVGDDPESVSASAQNIPRGATPVHDGSLTELLDAPVWIPFPDLFTMHHDVTYVEGTHRTLFYAESWILMHYLLSNDKLSEAGAYFGAVEIGKLPVEEAIQKAFGMTAIELQHAVKDHFRTALAVSRPGSGGSDAAVQTSPVPVGPEEIGMSTQDVPVGEAESLLAEMMVRLPEHRDDGINKAQDVIHDPKAENAIAHRALAWALLEKKDYSHASEELTQAAAINRVDPWVRYYLSLVKYRAALESGKTSSSLANMFQDLRAVLDWSPEFADAYHMLAVARLDGGGTNSATDAARMAVQLAPRNDSYKLTMAKIEMAGKKWDDAALLLERLKNSSDKQVARAARQQLDDLPTLKKYGILPAASTEAANSPSASSSSSPAEDSSGENADTGEEKPSGPVIDTRPVKFAKGKLIRVDCTATPVGVLTVQTGARPMKLRTENYKTLTLVGADQFSCDWKNQPVAVNYRPGGKADGDLVSLEVQ